MTGVEGRAGHRVTVTAVPVIVGPQAPELSVLLFGRCLMWCAIQIAQRPLAPSSF